MKVSTSGESVLDMAVDAIVLLACDGGKLLGEAEVVNSASGGIIKRLIAQGDLSTKVGQFTTLYELAGSKAKCVLVAGGGEASELSPGVVHRIAGGSAKRLADRMRERVVYAFGPFSDETVAAGIAGAINGALGQDLFRAERRLKPMAEIVWLNSSGPAVDRGRIIGEGMLLARELVNLPPNYLFPESFANRASAVAAQCNIELETWDELRLRRERCDSLLAVSAGSARPPRLLIMRYPGKQNSAPLVLVGKGVTFDSGGLSLKPTENMATMKCDMAGAATVLATMQTAARLELKTPVVGLVGLVENMLGGGAYKLGDVISSRSGKTIEILNTDAEGRVVLADVLDVARQEQPRGLIDLATLTGACVVALGTDVAGLMTNNEHLQARIVAAASECGELVWPLPMFPLFNEQIQSQVADIKNIGEGRWGGAITAGKFLEQFVGDVPWVHIDIAGPAFSEKPKFHIDAGASGCLVRTLVKWMENEGMEEGDA